MLKSISWKTRLANIVLELIVAALLILWIYTGISKLYDFQNFKSQLEKSPFIANYSTLIAYTLPIGEVLLGLLLVLKFTRRIALFISFGLMLAFTGYIYIMLHFAYDLPCSCGGVISKMTWNQHLWFNIGYTLLALIGICIIHNPGNFVTRNIKSTITTSKKR